MPESVPQTLNYMLAGYAVLLGFPLLYAVSWLWRRRQYEQHLHLLRSLQSDSERRAATQ
jgi:hypothetical protein